MKTDLKSVISRAVADFELHTGERANANQVVEAIIASYSGAAHALYVYIENRLLELKPTRASAEGLADFAEQTDTPRKPNETLDEWRARIIRALDPKPRIGTKDDLAFWATAYEDIRIAYPLSNQRPARDLPNAPPPENWMLSGFEKAFGYASLILVAKDDENGEIITLTEARKTQIRTEIEQKMPAGSFLFVKQSAPQLINFKINYPDATERDNIITALQKRIIASNSEAGILLTIEQIHSAILSVIKADDYTLIEPTQSIQAISDNYLKLGTVEWVS